MCKKCEIDVFLKNPAPNRVQTNIISLISFFSTTRHRSDKLNISMMTKDRRVYLNCKFHMTPVAGGLKLGRGHVSHIVCIYKV